MTFKTLLLSGLLLSAPAFAQTPSHGHGPHAAPPASSEPALAPAERKICRTLQEDTGTRIGSR